MRALKAIMAAVVSGLGVLSTGLDGGLTNGEIISTVATTVLAFGATWGVPNSGFLDLSSLTPAQRAELDRFLNLR